MRRFFSAFLLISACSPAPASPDRIVLETIAGDGNGAWNGDGPAFEVSLRAPIEVVFTPDGRPLILDWNNQRVRELSEDGELITVLGTGVEASGPANEPALEFSLHHTLDLESTPSGELFFAGYHDSRVLKVDAANRVRVVAGLGNYGDTGDEGPAQLASFREPSGVAVAADGTVFVSDSQANRIRRVDPEGTIHAFASEAQLLGPTRLALDPNGDLYVCDTANHSVRRIAPDGTMSTVAGDGSPGFSGDGGPAIEAQLYSPMDLELLDDGTLLIADNANHRIRRVLTDGTIVTVAGTGTVALSADGSAPLETSLHYPWGIALDVEGRLYIADTANNRLRRSSGALFGRARRR